MDKNFKLFVMIAIVFLGVAIAGSTFFILKTLGDSKAVSASSEKEKGSDKNSDLTIIDLGDAIATNVFDEQGEQHIMRVAVSFGVDASGDKSKEFSETFEAKKMVVRDEIIHIIREQTYEMMTKVDAQTKLGDEITTRVNKLLESEEIKKVYFGDFFVQ